MTALQNSVLIAGGSAVLYAATVTVIALISVLARTPERRRDALKVLLPLR